MRSTAFYTVGGDVVLEPNQVVLVVGVLIAAVIDARTGRIPNMLNGVLLLAGLVWWVIAGRYLVGILGAGIAFALHFVLWKLGVQKGGDAKLFIAIGALVGTREMFDSTAWTAVLYLPVGFLILAASGKLGNFVAGLRYAVDRAKGVSESELEKPEPTMLRTGPIIAAASILALFVDILPS